MICSTLLFNKISNFILAFGAPPAPPEKYTTSELDDIYLEDESGRVKLTGDSLQSKVLLTGCVVAVLGSEMTSGDFEVADVRFAEYAPQQKSQDLKKLQATLQFYQDCSLIELSQMILSIRYSKTFSVEKLVIPRIESCHLRFHI